MQYIKDGNCSIDASKSNNISFYPVNGNYTQWTMWTACDKSCGNGTRTRSRSCSNPAPANGGKTCLEQGLGDDIEDEECFLVHCPSKYYLFSKKHETALRS